MLFLYNKIAFYITLPKKVIGPSMKARDIPQQKTEGGIATRALNRMTSLGMPVSVKVR